MRLEDTSTKETRMSMPDPELTTDGGPISEAAPDDQKVVATPAGDAADPSPEESALAQPPYPTT